MVAPRKTSSEMIREVDVVAGPGPGARRSAAM
jgi:hypothetical protein